MKEERREIPNHTQEEMGKKSKAQGSDMKEMAPLYTDTACNRDAGISTWESMYRLLEEENPRIMKVAAVAGSQRSSEAFLEEIACSFLHKIAARPKILPYTDMIKSCIHVPTSCNTPPEVVRLLSQVKFNGKNNSFAFNHALQFIQKVSSSDI